MKFFNMILFQLVSTTSLFGVFLVVWGLMFYALLLARTFSAPANSSAAPSGGSKLIGVSRLASERRHVNTTICKWAVEYSIVLSIVPTGGAARGGDSVVRRRRWGIVPPANGGSGVPIERQGLRPRRPRTLRKLENGARRSHRCHEQIGHRHAGTIGWMELIFLVFATYGFYRSTLRVKLMF